MANTYTTNTRVTKQGTGDNPSTWGGVANTQVFDMFDEALGYKLYTMPSDADASISIADGTASEARGMFLYVASSVSLTATRALTLQPNTTKKLWFIYNGTSGSQSIEVKQGTGGSVTIASGYTAVVYADGAGAGAKVTNALANLQVTNLSGTITTAAQGTIDHDQLDNHVADQHVAHSGIYVGGASNGGIGTGNTIDTAYVYLSVDITNAVALSGSAATDDLVLLYDTSNTALRKATLADVVALAPQGTVTSVSGSTGIAVATGTTTPVVSLDIGSLGLTSIDSGDFLAVYTGAAHTKSTIQNVINTATIAGSQVSGDMASVTSIGATGAVKVNGSGQVAFFNGTPVSQQTIPDPLVLTGTYASEYTAIQTAVNLLRTALDNLNLVG